MEYSVIYEASSNRSFITIPYIIAVVFEIGLILYLILNWKHNSISGKVGIGLVGVILLLIIGNGFCEYVSSQKIYKQYCNEEFSIIEGVISNYEIGSNEKPEYPDRFDINGVDFIISNSPITGYGYSFRQIDGGILADGVKCKIYYIPCKFENVIMKLFIYSEI